MRGVCRANIYTPFFVPSGRNEVSRVAPTLSTMPREDRNRHSSDASAQASATSV